MSKPVVLLSATDELDGVPSYVHDLILKHFQILWLADFEKDASKYAAEVVAIIQLHARPKVIENLVRSLPNLKIVAVAGAGYNHLDIKMLYSLGIKVSTTQNVLNHTVADFAMTLLLAAGRNLFEVKEFAIASDTEAFQANKFSLDVSGTTLGIVGMGAIGHRVAERAQAFNMQILYHNRNRRSDKDEKAVNATYFERLHDMLPLCDYVIVLVCLTPETTKLIGTDEFKLMKSSAVFINISRGATVDQDALVDALSTGKIHFAALDVTDPEPLPRTHPLLKMSNVLITPHVASATLNTRRNMIQNAISNVLAALDGRDLPSEVKH